jgi:hypothetical protein
VTSSTQKGGTKAYGRSRSDSCRCRRCLSLQRLSLRLSALTTAMTGTRSCRSILPPYRWSWPLKPWVTPSVFPCRAPESEQNSAIKLFQAESSQQNMSEHSTVERIQSFDVRVLHRMGALREPLVSYPMVSFRWPGLVRLTANKWRVDIQFRSGATQYLQALKLRLRLNGIASLDEPFPSRPKRMHRKTYARPRQKGVGASRLSCSRIQ